MAPKSANKTKSVNKTIKKISATDFLSPEINSNTKSPSSTHFHCFTQMPRHRPPQLTSSPLLQNHQMKKVSSISDLKEMANSRLEAVKKHLERSHSEIVKDIDASHSRLNKRFKIQAQACQQVMDEAEKEYKKMSERISESKESLKASYSEIMAEAQASASRVCKTSIPELSQSFDKSLDVLRGRYGATTAM